VIGTLREAGFTVDLAAHAFSVIDSYVYGFAQQQQNLTYNTSQEAAEVAENVLRQIPSDQYLEVDRVWSSTRVGPDGFVVREIVATYIQVLEGTGDELAAVARAHDGVFQPPSGMSATQLKIFGGGAIIFDQWGRAKYHQRKPLFEWPRQQARLEYLARNGLRDRLGRFGFSYGLPEGQRFASLHEPGTDLEERW